MPHANYKRPIKCTPLTPTCANCKPPKHPCPQDVLFNCGTGTGVNTGFIGSGDTLLPPTTPIPLVCTTLDTTCLCKPIVKIKFDCTVGFTFAGLGDISILFQLKKSCDNGQNLACGTWALTRAADFTSYNNPFEFTFCDCDPCPGCCTYAVEIISFVIADIGLYRICVNAPTIQAIATETCGIQNANSSFDTSPCGVATGTYSHQEAKCPPSAPVCADCGPKHPCPQGVLFNCCTGTDIQTTSECPATTRSLVCVTIDTACLCKPLITLDFSAIVTASVPDRNTITLIFHLKKSCDNGQEIGCGTWTFERSVDNDWIISDSFRFAFCDCHPCPGCCTYSVELLSCRTDGSGQNPFAGSFSINAPTAAVLAVDTHPQHSAIHAKW
ncbi:MAG: DUF4489 domain-containing protein [Firmicutes bacterium]|nr:DUF4489 domain-containing protein [Bacillota bacterium]